VLAIVRRGHWVGRKILPVSAMLFEVRRCRRNSSTRRAANAAAILPNTLMRRPSAIAKMVPVASPKFNAMMEPQRMVLSRAYVTE
jgi:hypothetical protein